MLGAGWRVVVIGHEDHSPRPPEWHYLRLPRATLSTIRMRYLLMGSRALGLRMARAKIRRLRTPGARLAHSHTPLFRLAAREVRRFLREHPELRPDLVVSHDYFTADVGYEAARAAGARFTVDCHEYARGQYMHDPGWVRGMQPYIVGIQDYYLSRADAVTTVCDGIAELLNREQELKRPVQVIRSVPFNDRRAL